MEGWGETGAGGCPDGLVGRGRAATPGAPPSAAAGGGGCGLQAAPCASLSQHRPPGPLRNGSPPFRRGERGTWQDGLGFAPARPLPPHCTALGRAQLRASDIPAGPPHPATIPRCLILREEEARQPLEFGVEAEQPNKTRPPISSLNLALVLQTPLNPSENSAQQQRDRERARERPPPFQLAPVHSSSGQEALQHQIALAALPNTRNYTIHQPHLDISIPTATRQCARLQRKKIETIEETDHWMQEQNHKEFSGTA
ncbi:uncharacterized protein LOC127044943 isoform X2 [Gopherus flavomarginatus]|uniref:uncharacterized protein LOC127044943 isoform X2 n=1 Tax=Gopherus flavomarginatus TaxID=286002 RepID=UPI0021CBA354|nr:uncharacterized protein LOC127044943 isoform X2 [Gopherus flavomarginatus]